MKCLEECPKEPNIPIYLLVGGCFGLLKVMSLLYKQMKSRQFEKLDEMSGEGDLIVSNSSRFTETVLSLFLLVWFICGNYWVLHVYMPEFEQPLLDPKNWCDKRTYLFALVQILGSYCLMAFLIVLSCMLAVCHRYTSSSLDNS